jgi:NADPH:quinone reductase-like Zn-dependent oxidoreductase|eukprot:gene8599-9305_t
MQALWFEKEVKDLSEVAISNIPKPEIKPGHALVKVNIAASNPIDRLIFAPASPMWSYPVTSGLDFSGVVESVGVDVTNVKPGDAVFALSWITGKDDPNPTKAGAFAEYILIPASKLSKKPEALSFEVAAALPCVGSTAYQTIIEIGQVSQGTKLVVLGGSSVVGAIAIQLAKLRGAYVVTTASTRAFNFVQQFNADRIIDYTQKKWEEDGGLKDFDVLLDCTREPETLARALSNGVLKAGGKFITVTDHSYGFNPNSRPNLSWAAFYGARQSTSNQDELAELVVQGKLKIPIEATFPFTNEGIIQLFEKTQGGKSLGKNLLIILK